MSAALYAFFNAAGRPLRVVGRPLIDREPVLAARLLPVPAEPGALEAHRLPEGHPLARALAPGAERGEAAWLFYPAKRDRVRTVFFFRDGACLVRKDVLSRARRPASCPFSQRALPPGPIYPGHPVADDLARPARARDWDAAERVLARFFRALTERFPPDGRGLLPPETLDAVPRNCLADDAGRYFFFDLEYAMRGGVPLSYLVYSAVKADVASRLPKKERPAVVARLYGALCGRLSLEPRMGRDAAIARALKAFNTGSLRRRVCSALLSLLPVKRWRERLCWWSDRVALNAGK